MGARTSGIRQIGGAPGPRGGWAARKPLVLAAAVVVLALLPLYASDYGISVGILIFLYMSLGQMWNLLAGYSGLVSLGQQAFVGIGGYTLAMVTQAYHMSIALSFFIAAGVSLAFALVISFPIFKMSGVYFTVGTWIVSEALLVFFRNWAFVKYDAGYNITVAYRISMPALYLGALAVGLGATALVYFILRSRMGLALMAIRDDESAAEARGVRLYRTKLACFLISSVYTGITGVVLYLNITYVKPGAAFGIDWTVCMVFIVVIGGLGTIEGPVIGAVIYVILRQYTYNFPGISMIMLGVAAVAIIMLAPEGIMGAVHGRFGFRLFSTERRPPPGTGPRQYPEDAADV
ncbi:MAG: branched-chain amino acid ABC transporter permease [Clostridiales Family XIII bacterium]|jgi:branched-chain amino acid transport system permease protein|nr:branched-chain amino acid ABC transporter permease [Clostridiales Family XIII bacterium]